MLDVFGSLATRITVLKYVFRNLPPSCCCWLAVSIAADDADCAALAFASAADAAVPVAF